jgi:AcrR family transcriptional regulator
MAKARTRSKSTTPRRLPRGRHALAPEDVIRDQRERLLAAVPGVVAEKSYEATSVADIVKAAAVSRNAFYKNFSDKHECFATAHEEGHQRLFDTLTRACEAGETVEERIELVLAAALEALAADPDTARLLFVEAPSAGEEIALRYHEWLQRYGTLLRSATAKMESLAGPAAEVDEVIVGGIASRVASEVLRGRGKKLRELTAPFADYVLAFFRSAEPGPKEGRLLAFEPEPELYEARRKQAGA